MQEHQYLEGTEHLGSVKQVSLSPHLKVQKLANLVRVLHVTSRTQLQITSQFLEKGALKRSWHYFPYWYVHPVSGKF